MSKYQARNERNKLYKEFRDDQRRQREEEKREKARSGKKYLPNSLLPSGQDSDAARLTQRVRFSNEDEHTRRRTHRSSSNPSSSHSRENLERKREETRQDFYLYRQPQLNKALWETRPRIGNW